MKFTKMKYLNNMIRKITLILWMGYYVGILQAEVVITEFFILQEDATHVPQYVELYNNSDSPIDLENWSIRALDGEGEVIPYYPVFNSNGNAQINNTEIDCTKFILNATKHPKDKKIFPEYTLWYSKDKELMKFKFRSTKNKKIIEIIRKL